MLFAALNFYTEFKNNFMQMVSLGRWFYGFLKNGLLLEMFLLIVTLAIAVSFPQFSYQLEFINHSDEVYIGFLCIHASSLIIRRKLMGLLFSFCITVWALEIYQSLVLVVPVVVVFYCCLELWENKIDIKNFVLLNIRWFWMAFF